MKIKTYGINIIVATYLQLNHNNYLLATTYTYLASLMVLTTNYFLTYYLLM
jgi:hypothetical protein